MPLTPLLECALKHAAPPPEAALGAAMAAAGTFLLTGGGGTQPWGFGDNLMLACAVLFAAHFLALNHFASAPGAAPTIAVGQLGVSALLSWAAVPLDFPPFATPTPYLAAGVAATGAAARPVRPQSADPSPRTNPPYLRCSPRSHPTPRRPSLPLRPI